MYVCMYVCLYVCLLYLYFSERYLFFIVCRYFTRLRGLTPLMHCAVSGYDDVALLLLEFGAAIDAKDYRGDTALMWASKNGVS